MESQLQQSLIFLYYTTGIILFLVGVMLVKVLWDFDCLTKNLNKTVNIVKTELEPTLKNVNKSVEIISNLVIKTDEKINKVKELFKNTPFKIAGKLFGYTGKAAKGFLSGLGTAFKMFYKK